MVLNKVVDEFKKAEQMVEAVLRTDKRARSDDLWLCLMVWQRQQAIKVYVPYDKVAVMSRPSTLTRIRRVIQNDKGKFLPDDEVVLRRRKRMSDISRMMRR